VLVPLAMWTTHQLKTIIDMKAAKSALPNTYQPSGRQGQRRPAIGRRAKRARDRKK
jgi:hypothetical protein